VQPWPTDETHLSLEQRTEFQQLLIAQRLMTGEPDGVIGPATLEAVRTYQRAKSLPVDGFPSLTLLKMLRAEAPPPAPAPAVVTNEDQTGSTGAAQTSAGAEPTNAGQGQPVDAGGGQPANAADQQPSGQN
jgi:peptidoglycan hydrolase-like protein with peptidoglycan-binding domain